MALQLSPTSYRSSFIPRPIYKAISTRQKLGNFTNNGDEFDEFDGNIMGNISSASCVGISWEYHGKFMGNSWEYHGAHKFFTSNSMDQKKMEVAGRMIDVH